MLVDPGTPPSSNPTAVPEGSHDQEPSEPHRQGRGGGAHLIARPCDQEPLY